MLEYSIKMVYYIYMNIVKRAPRGYENNSFMTALASTLKEERRKADLTQVELAKRLGIGLASIRKIEQGNDAISMALVNKLLHYFGLQLVPEKLTSSPVVVNREIFDTKEVIVRLRALYPILTSKYSIERLGLFGSYAYGGQEEQSDIDIIVESRNRLSFKELGGIQIILEHIFEGKKIDLMQRSDVKQEYWSSIKEDLIYVS
jgi:predicted nucleotidyltransferase